jgi:hypothetical protein
MTRHELLNWYLGHHRSFRWARQVLWILTSDEHIDGRGNARSAVVGEVIALPDRESRVRQLTLEESFVRAVRPRV